MRSLEEQIGNKCKHYNGLSGPALNDDSATRCCSAGVVYATVENKEIKGFARYPCFREGASVPCDKREWFTPEEIAAEIQASEAEFESLKLGMAAACEDAAKHGFKKGSGGKGSVVCPVCKTGTLYYTVASYNGHMWGKCSTRDCLGWMQ